MVTVQQSKVIDLIDFRTQHDDIFQKHKEIGSTLPNIDVLKIIESIIWDALDHVPTRILLDPKKYSEVNFVYDFLDASSTSRTSTNVRPFKKRKHGIVIDTDTSEILITIRKRDKEYCPKCDMMNGKHSFCWCKVQTIKPETFEDGINPDPDNWAEQSKFEGLGE